MLPPPQPCWRPRPLPSRPGAPRHIAVDVGTAGEPLDRSFNLSVGADYPGTLIRPENLAQLRTSVDEHGFRYIRFHAIFHDDLGTVKVVDGKTVYDWTKIDQLYDAFLGMGIKPFVELGFTPEVDEDLARTRSSTGTARPRIPGPTCGATWSTPSSAT